jgi:hypothetical protein
MNKYHSVLTEVDNIKFDSKKEERRYQELKLLERAGEIMSLDVHPTYLLQESFMYQGKKIQPITYAPDFRYVENGATVCEDVKGIDRRTGKPITLTEATGIKIKMFKKLNPHIDFRIV